MNYQPLTVQQLDTVLDQDGAILIDTRDHRSYQEEHIPGALFADDHTVKRLLRTHSGGQPIVVYCYRGNSSREFCNLLAQFGFDNLHNLEGGWQAWRKAQGPLKSTGSVLGDWLFEHGFNPENLNSRIDNGTSPLMLAAQQGKRDLVRQLLEQGADVNLLNDDHNPALWFACFSNDPELVASLIRAGASLDNQNVNGATCAIYAASTGKLEVLKLLTEAGADLFRETLDGFTALESASTLPVLRFLKTHTSQPQVGFAQELAPS